MRIYQIMRAGIHKRSSSKIALYVGPPIVCGSARNQNRTFHIIIYCGITNVGSFLGINIDTLTGDNQERPAFEISRLFFFRFRNRNLKLIISILDHQPQLVSNYANTCSFNSTSSYLTCLQVWGWPSGLDHNSRIQVSSILVLVIQVTTRVRRQSISFLQVA